jgi:hypothetical protein
LKTMPAKTAPVFHDREEAERRVREGLAAGKLSLQLRGEKLKGSYALVRTKEAKSWLLIKHKDRFVSTDDITAQDRSVLSGLRVKDLKLPRRVPSARVAPGCRPARSHARWRTLRRCWRDVGEAAFQDARWLWEPKLDGYRVHGVHRTAAGCACARGAGSMTPHLSALVGGTQGSKLAMERMLWMARSSPSTRRAGRRSTRCRTASS